MASSSDQTVTARDVLRALAEVRRRGSRAALEEFEKREPDLAEFLIEEVSALHHDVLASGADPRKARALSRRFERLAVVLVTTLRHAHLRLWGQQDEPTGADAPMEPAGEPEAGDPEEGGQPDGPDARP
jgi:hypothetical protein